MKQMGQHINRQAPGKHAIDVRCHSLLSRLIAGSIAYELW
jgi:hypothetical protein